MNVSEIRDLPSEEIREQLADSRRALLNLRFQGESEQLERTAEITKTRKDIARLLTVLREREISEQAAQAVDNQKD